MDEHLEPVRPPDADVMAELGRIWDSKTFQRRNNAKNILRYIVLKTLQGESIGEESIARDVLDRRDFNPAVNRQVVVEKSKLTKWLNQYYTKEGSANPIVIRIDRYQAKITFNTAPRNVDGSRRYFHSRLINGVRSSWWDEHPPALDEKTVNQIQEAQQTAKRFWPQLVSSFADVCGLEWSTELCLEEDLPLPSDYYSFFRAIQNPNVFVTAPAPYEGRIYPAVSWFAESVRMRSVPGSQIVDSEVQQRTYTLFEHMIDNGYHSAVSDPDGHVPVSKKIRDFLFFPELAAEDADPDYVSWSHRDPDPDLPPPKEPMPIRLRFCVEGYIVFALDLDKLGEDALKRYHERIEAQRAFRERLNELL